MSEEFISAVGAIKGVNALDSINPMAASAPSAVENVARAGTDFAVWFSNQMGSVNGQLMAVEKEIQAVAMGDTQNLHQLMIHMEETRLSFQLLTQVRNRVLEAYQEVMRMQI